MKPDSNPTVPSFLSAPALSEREEVAQSGLEQRIREKAYEIWNLEGQPEGREHEHWQRAEALVHQEDSPPPAAD